MGDSPSEFVTNFDKDKRRTLKDFKHRFTTGDDISDLLTLFRTVISRYGSIEQYFARGYNPGDRNIIPALSEFCNSLLDIHAAGHKGQATRGLKYLLVSPAGGSACKRLNLFLRWMVRVGFGNRLTRPGLSFLLMCIWAGCVKSWACTTERPFLCQQQQK